MLDVVHVAELGANFGARRDPMPKEQSVGLDPKRIRNGKRATCNRIFWHVGCEF